MKIRSWQGDGLCLACCLLLYAGNRLLFIHYSKGLLHFLLACYGNDVLAGCAVLALLNGLLRFGGYPPVVLLRLILGITLACGIFWEFIAPIWNPQVVYDPWDFAAYLLGGLIYFFLNRSLISRQR